ncbi:putative oxidoreductase OrdL [Nymphon striatum]|nr:putative oxidoreductase OrdL [Nymphon striatum]
MSVLSGGGYTGLSAALHLAQAGRKVVLLDAHRVGFGASGRNGGQLGSGQRMEQTGLETLVGDETAHRLWDLAEDAKALVKGLIREHNIECYLKPGVAWVDESRAGVQDLHDYAAHLEQRYGYSELTVLDADGCAAMCPSPAYKGGILDTGAAHLHPLRLALGLARAADAAGVAIYEGSHVHHIQHGKTCVVQTDRGRVVADHVILAGNGYLGGLERKVLAQDVAVADGRFVVNYFRLSHDGRLLFGGGESYGYRFPKDIRKTVSKPMLEIFPHLRDVRLDYAWGGTLGITMKRMPYLARLGPNVLSASGYSGHGVGTAIHAGKLMALAIEGQSDGFDVMSAVPAPAFPGGGAMRTPLLALAMSWYALRDRLGL